MNEPNSDRVRMLSPNDLAALLNVSKRTVQTLRAAGRLPAPDLHIRKILRWRPETITNWLAQRPRRGV